MQINTLLVPLVAALVSVTGATHADISIDQLIEQARIKEGGVAIRERSGWSQKHKILVRDVNDFNLEEFLQGRGDVEFVTVNSVAEAMHHANDVDAIIGYCNADLIAAAEKLVWVQIFSAGAERCLAVEQIRNGDIVMTNMQKMSAPVIAEHAIAMMMSLARHLPQIIRASDKHGWGDRSNLSRRMMPVAGKKLLVVGLGGIGTEVARLGATLGMRVSGTRYSSRSGPDYVDYVGLSNELLDLAAEADVVVSALPLTNTTQGLFDAEFFAAIKPGAIFINVGRGKTVVTGDLVAALESGHLSGVGVDVTDPEPLPSDHAMWQYDNVIITPHVASRGGERKRHKILLIENLKRYFAGDRLLNVVDPQKGY